MNVSDFRPSSKEVAVGIIGVAVLLVVVYCILSRTGTEHHNTDNTVADLEKRIDRIEQRVDSISAGLDKAEKTNTELGGKIESSTNLAKEVGAGIDGLQDRLDSAIQRGGRIANLIADIENANRQGTKGSQKTGVAK